MLAEALPFYDSLSWQKKFKGRYTALNSARILSAANPEQGVAAQAETNPPDLPEKIHCIMPETYMNLSGESVLAAASFFKIKAGEILVIHDELEIPLGTISLKLSGGLGGHNGLRSMKSCFGSADFWRLRIGIGRPDNRLPGQGGPAGSGRGIADWVLSDFSGAEAELLAPALDAGAGLLLRALVGSPEKLLPEWGKKKISG
ncbi:peptidyl-tRNA hydrolase [Spirochaetia bacterium]|nr:peptidyl-tRNA hydrolase [Spirochaetia bacterium]